MRHALVHTQKLKQSLRGIDGECTSISDVSPLDGFVMSSEPGLKELDIVDNMRRMEEKLDIVAAYVLTQSNIISESLAYRPVAAERLLESMGIEGDGSLSNSSSGDDGQTANISILQGEWKILKKTKGAEATSALLNPDADEFVPEMPRSDFCAERPPVVDNCAEKMSTEETSLFSDTLEGVLKDENVANIEVAGFHSEVSCLIMAGTEGGEIVKVQNTAEEEKYNNMQQEGDVSENVKGEELEIVRSEVVKTENVQSEGEESDESRSMVHVQDTAEGTKNEWSEMDKPAQEHSENEQFAEVQDLRWSMLAHKSLKSDRQTRAMMSCMLAKMRRLETTFAEKLLA